MASANDKVVLALIGAGGRETQVILSMQKCTPRSRIKYVCDVDKERGGRAIDGLEKQKKAGHYGLKMCSVIDLLKVSKETVTIESDYCNGTI